MKSSKFSPKRTVKSSSEEISGFDLFYQLAYMSATSAAGVSRGKVFELARAVAAPPARYFRDVDQLADKLRYNYPDACRMIAARIKSEDMRTFLLRFSDALRSGEPLAGFLEREALVQADKYENEYERQMESLKKWNDAYTSVTISVALVVVINMVSTMIYSVGTVVMVGMVFGALVTGFVVAWVLSRSAPQETMAVDWGKGSQQQKLGLKLAKIFGAITVAATTAMVLLHVPLGWVFIVIAVLLVPPGIVAMGVEKKVGKKDDEVSAFFRSIGGTATSRGTTLGEALRRMQISSFPALESDITRLGLRLKASAKPQTCWSMFALETGSRLITQATGIFFESTNLGGDPDTVGVRCSLFASRTAMLRAKRRNAAESFSWLTLVMHAVVSGLLVFILEILKKFLTMIQAAMPSDAAAGMRSMAVSMLSFNTPQVAMMEQITVGMLIIMAFINSFAVIASEGAHIVKAMFYLSLMFLLTGIAFLIIPSLLSTLM